jgi:hypothetical protein
MEKKILFGILFSAILAINIISVSKTDISDLSLMSLMQTAQAQTEGGECYPWSPGYNIVTGKCDPPDYSVSYVSHECQIVYYDEMTATWKTKSHQPPTYWNDCTWAVAGNCIVLGCI